MIKLAKALTTLLLVTLFFANSLSAQMVELKKGVNRSQEELKVAAFLDYPPFGDYVNPPYRESFVSIFQPIIKEYAEKQNFEVIYILKQNYSTSVRDVRRGEIDMLLGMYHETAMYTGLEYIFPAAINNPIVAVMLPSRIGQVKSKKDLKKLRGAMSSHEHLSDFVNQELKEYQLKKFDKSYDMYERLFAGEIDYILGSQYFSIIEASKLGLRKKVSFSKQALWNMPMFIGVSKTSPHKKFLSKTFTTMMERPETLKQINQILIDTINKVEKDNIGVVPPSFSKDRPITREAEPQAETMTDRNTMIMVQPPSKRK